LDEKKLDFWDIFILKGLITIVFAVEILL